MIGFAEERTPSTGIIDKVDVAIQAVRKISDKELGEKLEKGLLELRNTLLETHPGKRIFSFKKARDLQLLIMEAEQIHKDAEELKTVDQDILNLQKVELEEMWCDHIGPIQQDVIDYANGKEAGKSSAGKSGRG